MAIYLGGGSYIGKSSLIYDAILFVSIYIGCLVFFSLLTKKAITKKVALDLVILASAVAMSKGFLRSQIFCSGSLCVAPLLAVNRERLLFTMFYDSLLPFIFLMAYSFSNISSWLRRLAFIAVVIFIYNIFNLNLIFMLI